MCIFACAGARCPGWAGPADFDCSAVLRRGGGGFKWTLVLLFLGRRGDGAEGEESGPSATREDLKSRRRPEWRRTPAGEQLLLEGKSDSSSGPPPFVSGVGSTRGRASDRASPRLPGTVWSARGGDVCLSAGQSSPGVLRRLGLRRLRSCTCEARTCPGAVRPSLHSL